jgi:hypothetical protein
VIEPMSMNPRAKFTVVVLVYLALGACSGAKKEPKNEPDDTAGGSDDVTQPDDAATTHHDDGGGAGEDGPKVEPSPKPAVREQDYEITYTDCEALAQAYAGAWEHDEMEKLNKKGLPEKQFQAAQEQLQSGKQHMLDNWLSECQKTVGTAYLYKNLQCATKARTLQRFNDCWEGKVQE